MGVMFTGLRGCLGLVRAFAVRVWGLGAGAKARNDSTQTAQKCYFGFGLVWAGSKDMQRQKANGTAREKLSRPGKKRHGTRRRGTAQEETHVKWVGR